VRSTRVDRHSGQFSDVVVRSRASRHTGQLSGGTNAVSAVPHVAHLTNESFEPYSGCRIVITLSGGRVLREQAECLTLL
jgi:hypothetical protein